MPQPGRAPDGGEGTQTPPSPVTLRLWIVAAVYLGYLGVYFVYGGVPYAREGYNWHEALLLGTTAGALFAAALRTQGCDRLFLIGNALAAAILLLSEMSYGQDLAVWRGSAGDVLAFSDVSYACFLFVWVGTWSLMATCEAQRQRPGPSTIGVFALLMLGLVVLFSNFYAPLYAQHLAKAEGRLDATVAALELAALVAGIAVTQLGARYPVVLMFVGAALAAVSDMFYSEGELLKRTSAVADPLWTLGLCLTLAGALTLRAGRGDADLVHMRSRHRSGLSTLLLTISLGAVLVSAIVAQALHARGVADTARESFFFVLFVIGLVLLMTALTDLYDRAVARAGEHLSAWLAQRLSGPDWRSAPAPMAWVLKATGLGQLLDHLQASAAALRRDVIFLGPERLNPPPHEPLPGAAPTCFIVMPFGQPESDLVHRVLREACLRAGLQPVRGDDLFTPSDILDDIWRGITGAQCVVADITGRNPNVMYELGIAHTLAKPVLILSRHPADIPIDLATRRVIVYGTGADGKGPGWPELLAQRVGPAIEGLRAGAVALQPAAR